MMFDQKIYVDLSGYKEGVTPVTADLGGQSVGLARVIVPSGVDRDQYVADCYRTGRIDLYDESQGTYLKQCYATNEVLANLKFPRGVGDIGDPVVWVAQPTIFNRPMVVGTFPSGDRMRLGTDQTIEIHKEWDKGYVDVTADAKDGSLNVVVHGQEKSGGTVRVSVLGDEKSILEVKSDGLVSVESGKELRVRSYEKIDIQLENPDNLDQTGVVVTKDSVDIAANYSVDEENAEKVNYTKTHITKDGVSCEEYFCEDDDVTKYNVDINKEGFIAKSAIRGDEVQFTHIITDEEYRIEFKDIIFSLKERLAVLQQGEDTKIELKEGKVAIINSGTGMNDILSLLVDTIEKLTVATSMGPSGTPLPPTIQATTQLKQKLNQFFNE
jgi:hypothetical protein|nr:MAG TPA: hypothetical protein [Herelleviridae sp.]